MNSLSTQIEQYIKYRNKYETSIHDVIAELVKIDTVFNNIHDDGEIKQYRKNVKEKLMRIKELQESIAEAPTINQLQEMKRTEIEEKKKKN